MRLLECRLAARDMSGCTGLPVRRPAMGRPQKSAIGCWKQKCAARVRNADAAFEKQIGRSALPGDRQIFQVIDNFLSIGCQLVSARDVARCIGVVGEPISKPVFDHTH